MTCEHGNFVERIAGDDGRIVFEFYAVFSRFEYALKRSGFVKGDKYKNAVVDWDRFAAEVLDGRHRNEMSRAFTRGKTYLLQTPPDRQVVRPDQSVGWQKNPRRSRESDGQYLLRLVRDVRNNLFHGGKYPAASGGPVDKAALRNADLLAASAAVLGGCLAFDVGAKQFFKEAG
jgi:hypothetical protein